MLAMSPIASMDHVPDASEVAAPAKIINYENNSKIGLRNIDSTHAIKTEMSRVGDLGFGGPLVGGNSVIPGNLLKILGNTYGKSEVPVNPLS